MKKVQPLKGILLSFLFLLTTGVLLAQPCGCNFTIATTVNSFDGTAKGVKPGDRICFANGTRGGIWLNNIIGTPDKPVILSNTCDGAVFFVAASNLGQVIDVTNSKYFRITGSNNPAVALGIDVKGAQQGMNLRDFSTDFEVDHVYVHDTGSGGIIAKTDPTCNTATWRGNFTLQNLKFHDITIERTFTEGFYIGNSHWDHGVTKTCNGVSTVIMEHAVINVEIYNNYLNSTGNEAIQVGSTKNAVAHHNIVINPGAVNPDPAQSNGFQAGSGTQMTAYANIIDGGRGYGIFDSGGGGTYYNNIVMNALSGGMLCQDLPDDFAPTGYRIYNNTFINNKDVGIWMYSENPNMTYYYNNIIVGQNQANYKYVLFNNQPAIKWTESNNIRTQDITTLKFVDAANKDFRLLAGSPAIDAGKDVSSYFLTDDFDGKGRAKGAGYDVGAFEFQPAGPKANAGPDQSLTLPTNSISLPGTGTSATGITSYQWTKKVGGAATLANANTPTLSVSGLVEGIYIFELKVTDASGFDFDNVTVTVLPATANVNPVANAGGNKTITLPTSSVTLNGIGTDADGSIASYAWIKVSGPASGTLTGASTPNLALSGLVAGTYVFQLTVTDDKGATASSQATVTVNAAGVNQLPVVNAGATKTIFLPTTSISITATASDPDGTIATILWEKKSGGALGALTGANTLTMSATGLALGAYTFRITVTDNSGGTSFSEVIVNVLQGNQSPVADAGSNQSITLPTNTITLNGVGTDPDGTIASYAWTKVSGPTATLAGAATQNLTVTNMLQGTYVFGLTVTDNSGATGYDEVTVLVSVTPAVSPEIPLAMAGGNVSFSLPTNSTNLYGSGFDPDGTIVSYSWTKASGGAATLTNADKPTLTVSGLVAGQYTFRLTVTDNGGNTDDDIAIVTVSDAGTNVFPVASAGADKIVKLPVTSTTLTGSGSDVDGQVVSFAWSKVSGANLNILTPTQSSTIINGLAEGTYVLRLMVTDNLGASDINDVTVRVVASTNNLPPVVDAGADKQVFLPTNTVTLNASASDDGTITQYQWVKLSGPAATLVNPTQLNLTVQDLVQGSYSFQLSVTDNNGATVFDIVKVNVLPATFNPPTVDAGPDVAITLPTSQATLTGTASSTSGTITSTVWTQIVGAAATMTGGNTLSLQVSGLSQGTYVFKLTATDNSGKDNSDNVQIVVNPVPPNKPPVVFAGVNTVLNLPVSQISLTGTATDSDGTVASVAWTQVQGPASTLNGANTLTLTVPNPVEGSYVFRLTATDNQGATGFAEVIVSVVNSNNSNPVNRPPVVSAGQDVVVVLPENTATVTGVASDPDGNLVGDIVWEQISGPAATMAVRNQTILDLSDLVAGQYEFSLTATDDAGASASDQVLVSVIEKDQEIPKFFSPNADGRGDVWIFRNVAAYNQCKLQVFSRSGALVYEASPYDNSWDGTYNGKVLGDGDYYYSLSCDDGRKIAGAVRIIR